MSTAIVIGFDFVRLRFTLAPWTETASNANQQTILTLTADIVQQVLNAV